ncbi:hypothetical protein PseAD21_11955 [Pseudomonas sp. AD21]|nr:hypothetical protein PseAD21_11955 [Pseudomonas sp. AD21]
MRAGTENALAKVVTVFSAAKPHYAYIFANRKAKRMKVLVHDGIGVWLAGWRVNQGNSIGQGPGLPFETLGSAAARPGRWCY